MSLTIKEMQLCRICKEKEGSMIGASVKSTTKFKTRLYLRCNDCNNKYVRKFYSNNKKIAREIMYKSIAKYPHKQKARIKVRAAILSGILTRPERCPICDSDKKIEGHHKDYSKPLEVEWMCTMCHRQTHKNSV